MNNGVSMAHNMISCLCQLMHLLSLGVSVGQVDTALMWPTTVLSRGKSHITDKDQ